MTGMLKKWEELRALDISKYCKTRKAKDDKGNWIEIPYLPWGKCIDLLHENGAEKVSFTPIMVDGSYLLCSREVSTTTKQGDIKTTGCYFVRVLVEIDDLKWEYDYPLLNGAIVVYDDTLNQRIINTAHNRAFVKAVAIKTGLGWSLWSTDDEDEDVPDDPSRHSIFVIQKRLQETVSRLMQKMSLDDIAKSIGWSRKLIEDVLNRYPAGIAKLESELQLL
jgi:hypothetical protein